MFDSKTEVLTSNGWKRADEIEGGTIGGEVATLNLQTGNVEFVPKGKVKVKEVNDKKVEFEGQNCNGAFTGNHTCLIVRRDSLEWKYALNLKEGMSVPICWTWDKEDLEIEDGVLRLLVWIAADGTLENTDLIRFHLKKDRKIKRLVALLKSLQIDYSLNKQSDGTVKINFNTPEFLSGYRVKSLDEKLIQTSKRQADLIVDEYLQTDGNMTSKNSFQITTSRKEEADVLQSIFILHGHSCNILARKKNNNQEYVISAGNKKSCKLSRVKIKSSKRGEQFYSIETDNNTLFVRRNGLVHITGV